MLIFYDYDFNLLCAERNVIKSSWELKYNGVGTFEAELPAVSDVLKLLNEEKYLIVRDETECGVIVGWQLSDKLCIYARTCNWLLGRRIAEPAQYSGNVGTSAVNLIQTAFGDVDILFAVDAECGEYETNVTARAAVLDTVINLLAADGLGHKLEFDYANKQWVFRIFRGTERPLLISEANRNAYDTCITDDILDLYTCAVYDGGTADSGNETGFRKWQTSLGVQTEEEAKAALKNKQEKSELTLKLRGIEYGTDYRLGDEVRVQIIAGNLKKTQKKRIGGLFVRRGDNIVYEPVFENITEVD